MGLIFFDEKRPPPYAQVWSASDASAVGFAVMAGDATPDADDEALLKRAFILNDCCSHGIQLSLVWQPREDARLVQADAASRRFGSWS